MGKRGGVGEILNDKNSVNAAAFPGHWIFAPAQDLAFVLLTPAAILLAFAAARRANWMDGLISFGLALAMAHYLPGILRAYGDRSLFRRFRTRLILAPLFLTATTVWFAYLNLHIVILLALLWGAWHWMMQIYGFGRLYDARTPSASRTPARLDQMICLLWFGMCVFVLNNDLPSYVKRFYESGGPSLPANAFEWFIRAWFAVTVAVTLFYVIRTLWTIRAGQRPNLLKLLLFLVTFVYLKYTISVAERPLMGLVMFESWHDIQYLTIVWWFNANRAQKAPEAGRFIRFLFRPRLVLVLVYVGLCLAFGSLTHAWQLFENEAVVRIAVSLVTATALLHYYLDGFIWKIRDTETRQTLLGAGARPEASPVLPGLISGWAPAWVRHAFLWLLFLIPSTVFLVRESRGHSPKPLELYQNLVETFPDSADAQYELGRELQDSGRLREARPHLERAVTLAPAMLPARKFLGILLADQGELAGSRTHFEYVLSVDPQNAEVQNDLGMIFEEQGDHVTARAHLESAVAINPQYALAQNNLGIILAASGDLGQARVHHERAVAISPGFAEAHYQLGVTLARLGDMKGAVDHLEEALRIEPDLYLAHNGLGVVLAEQGKLSEARMHFEEALQIKPGYVSAQQNLAAALQDLKTPPGR